MKISRHKNSVFLSYCQNKTSEKDEHKVEWTPAEILSIRKNSNGENQYYVHYVDFNKRLDEWVTRSRLDLRYTTCCIMNYGHTASRIGLKF